MGPEKIAYLGPKASYTHQAALDTFDSDEYQLVPCVNIDDVFTHVQGGASSFGVVPFENSTNGAVIMTLDLFSDKQSKHSDIVVCGEIYVPVHHCLLGRIAPSESNAQVDGENKPLQARNHSFEALSPGSTAPSSGTATPTLISPFPASSRSKPLHSISHIEKLLSHPQAWGQCKSFLSTYLKTTERKDSSSTSRAAEAVAQDPSGTSAAVCSELAARIYGLDVLARQIEDETDNKTRFFVLGHRGTLSCSSSSSPASTTTPSTATSLKLLATQIYASGQPQQPNSSSDPKFKSLVSLTVSNDSNPGALADALAVFKSHSLNLTSINPRPSGAAPWHYRFFVEFEGRKGTVKVDEALLNLERVVREWRFLGSWASAL